MYDTLLDMHTKVKSVFASIDRSGDHIVGERYSVIAAFSFKAGGSVIGMCILLYIFLFRT